MACIRFVPLRQGPIKLKRQPVFLVCNEKRVKINNNTHSCECARKKIDFMAAAAAVCSRLVVRFLLLLLIFFQLKHVPTATARFTTPISESSLDQWSLITRSHARTFTHYCWYSFRVRSFTSTCVCYFVYCNIFQHGCSVFIFRSFACSLRAYVICVQCVDYFVFLSQILRNFFFTIFTFNFSLFIFIRICNAHAHCTMLIAHCVQSYFVRFKFLHFGYGFERLVGSTMYVVDVANSTSFLLNWMHVIAFTLLLRMEAVFSLLFFSSILRYFFKWRKEK